MKTLIILAHGSRRKESNQEIHFLTDKVRKQVNGRFDVVEYAFLELAEPNLITVINEMIENGSDEITIHPYFLNSGNHVKKDIPEILDAVTKEHSDCKFNVTPCIGTHKNMPRMILEQTN